MNRIGGSGGSGGKRIFISDIHLCDRRGMGPGAGYVPYAALYPPRTTMLETFLHTRIFLADDVKELIILGDLFDQWLCPVEFTPPSFEDIAVAPQNAGIMQKLRDIAARGKTRVIYVPGNHDMLVDEGALDFFGEFLPGVVYGGSGPGRGVFKTDDGICAEHGNVHTLLYSPDYWSHGGGWLPLGFYTSRAGAQKEARQGVGFDPLEVAANFARNFVGGAEFSKSYFMAFARDAGLDKNSPIMMDGLDNNPGSITVGAVAGRYGGLMDSWKPLPPADLTAGYALVNMTLGLDGAAQSGYFLENRARIVIFGHTHRPILSGYLRGDNYCELNLYPGRPCDYIYANSGTWVNRRKYCTYVETEPDENRGRHYVRLFRFSATRKKGIKVAQRYILT